jgi:uncharacterized YigZ family protein
MNEYFSIAKPVATKLKVKDSRFIAFLCPVETRQEAETRLAERMREFHDATHHCYAFRIGFGDGMMAKSSDAGEPVGTAGRPLLQALERHNLTNVLLVVTRYFGGTKLGTGGLIRAYAGAAAAVIEQTSLMAIYPKQVLRLRYAYPQGSAVRKVLHQIAAKSIREEFDTEVTHWIEVRVQNVEKAQRLLREACAGKIVIEMN